MFCWGTFVSGSFLPTATTWLYGAYHLATTHLPLLLLLATSLNSRREHDYSLVRTLRNNGLMLVIVLKQVWLGRLYHIDYQSLSQLITISKAVIIHYIQDTGCLRKFSVPGLFWRIHPLMYILLHLFLTLIILKSSLKFSL